MRKNKKLRLVFVSHESSLSGAPILLLNLLKLLIHVQYYEINIIIRRGNILDTDFMALGVPVLILKPKNYQENKRIIGKILDYIGYRLRLKQMLKIAGDADVIISNTITNGRLLNLIYERNKNIITYVHELKQVMIECNTNGDSELSLKLSKSFFSPSKVVTSNLVENNKVQNEKIFPLNYRFMQPVNEILKKNQDRRQSFLRKYNIQEGKFYVAGMGAAALRKGIDIFVEVCYEVCKTEHDTHFVWIGGFLDKPLERSITDRINEFGLDNKLTITGFIPRDIYNLLPFDLLALTSREDPYPLVVIEAALLNIPTIGFRSVGGAEEFIDVDAGILVPNNSIKEYAKAIIDLKNNFQRLHLLGKNAQRKATQIHLNDKFILEQFREGLNFVKQ